MSLNQVAGTKDVDYGPCRFHTGFRSTLVMKIRNLLLLLKNRALRRDLDAFRQRFQDFSAMLALRLAGHILFRGSKKPTDVSHESTVD